MPKDATLLDMTGGGGVENGFAPYLHFKVILSCAFTNLAMLRRHSLQHSFKAYHDNRGNKATTMLLVL